MINLRFYRAKKSAGWDVKHNLLIRNSAHTRRQTHNLLQQHGCRASRLRCCGCMRRGCRQLSKQGLRSVRRSYSASVVTQSPRMGSLYDLSPLSDFPFAFFSIFSLFLAHTGGIPEPHACHLLRPHPHKPSTFTLHPLCPSHLPHLSFPSLSPRLLASPILPLSSLPLHL